MFLTSFMRWPRKGKWAIRIRKTAIVSGFLLCAIALADRFDKLPGTSSEDLAVLLPFPAPGIAVQIGIFAIGIFLIRGPKYRVVKEKAPKKRKREYSTAELDYAYMAGGNLGSLSKSLRSKRASKYKTVGELWGDQKLSEFEDEFEGGLRDNFSASIGRTCHLCNGAGCQACNYTGVLS